MTAHISADFRQQTDIRMPRPGEGWRYYEHELYEIVGIAMQSESHCAVVIYKPWGWSLAQEPPLFACPIEVFLGTVSKDGLKFRFKFEREPEIHPPALRED